MLLAVGGDHQHLVLHVGLDLPHLELGREGGVEEERTPDLRGDLGDALL